MRASVPENRRCSKLSLLHSQWSSSLTEYHGRFKPELPTKIIIPLQRLATMQRRHFSYLVCTFYNYFDACLNDQSDSLQQALQSVLYTCFRFTQQAVLPLLGSKLQVYNFCVPKKCDPSRHTKYASITEQQPDVRSDKSQDIV